MLVTDYGRVLPILGIADGKGSCGESLSSVHTKSPWGHTWWILGDRCYLVCPD